MSACVANPPGRWEPLLYLDFDGVLSHERVLHDATRGPYLDAPARYRLFQYAPLLTEMLAHHPRVGVVLSTAWAHKYGVGEAVRHLPSSLQLRVLGATSDLAQAGDSFAYLSKGEQVALDVKRRRPSCWIALDDELVGWPEWTRAHVIFTNPYEGISPPAVQDAIRGALRSLPPEFCADLKEVLRHLGLGDGERLASLHRAQNLQTFLMNRAAVALLREQPKLVRRVEGTLSRWRERADAHSAPLLEGWANILATREWDAALANTPEAQQLRQASPLAGLLSDDVRLAIIRYVSGLKHLE
jgi:hypothetical protein